MYLTRESIHNLEEIIVNLNILESEEEKKEFLNEHVEDSILFISALKKVNKSNLPKEYARKEKMHDKNANVALYDEEDIMDIFREKDNTEIVNEYSSQELRQMYSSVYNRKAPSNYTKARIVSIFRDRLHTINRASAFAKMAKEREKR